MSALPVGYARCSTDHVTAAMRFRVPGPVIVSTAQWWLNLHGDVARRVLTTLMLSPGRAVPVLHLDAVLLAPTRR